MTQGFGSFHLYLVVVRALAKVLAMWQVLVLGSDGSFLSANQNENLKNNSIKNNSALSFYRKSL